MRKAFPCIKEDDDEGQSGETLVVLSAQEEKMRRAIIKEHLAESMGDRDPNTVRVKKVEKKFEEKK